MENLWPQIEVTAPKAPVAILKEQASLLGKQTQNLVIAEVTPLDRQTNVDSVLVDTTYKVRWREIKDYTSLLEREDSVIKSG